MKEGALNLNLRSQMSMGVERWFNSTNAKDIGTLYLIFALFSGLLGTAMSVLIRLELSGPGVQFIANNQLYNSIVTAHALLMIFFMVKTKKLFNLQFSSQNNIQWIQNKNLPKYYKIIIEDPYHNRKKILETTKNKKGVYVWTSNEFTYVGHSINLYNRIRTYFMPSILKRRGSKVLRYFSEYGFNDTVLTLYILDDNSSIENIVQLEQYFIDVLEPNLNVYLVASSSIKIGLSRERSTTIYMYKESILVYVFTSKQELYNSINVHHRILTNCLNKGILYLNTYTFQSKKLENSNVNLLKLKELNKEIKKIK